MLSTGPRTLLLLAALVASAPTLGCSASLRRGVTTTEAATPMQQVTHSATNELDPAVSPDARRIAYEVTDSLDATPRLEVTTLAGLSASTPAPPEYSSKSAAGMEPAWMPDGTGLVFVSNALGAEGLVETFGASLGNSFLARAGDPGLSAAWPALSPDARSMAMSLPRARLFDTGWRHTVHLDSALAISDLSGSGLTVLGEGADPAWSPRGDRLAFVRSVGGRSHLFVARADGSDPRQVTEGPDDDRQPAWSPDGSTLAYCSAHGTDGGWTQANLFTVRPDGSHLEQLTEGDRVACRPAWASDGFIYFHANATDKFHIWRLRPRAQT